MIDRPVPFSNWDEWRRVQEWLMSSDSAERLRGIEQVRMWQVRGRVPLAVNLTTALIMVREEYHARSEELGKSSYADYAMRLQMAMAVTRFVNGIVDTAQRGAVASSVSRIAEALDIPRVCVEMRHQATHQHLPELPVCVSAVDESLSWLKESYWKQQLEEVTTIAPNAVEEALNEWQERHAVSTDPREVSSLLSKIAALCSPNVVCEHVCPWIIQNRVVEASLYEHIHTQWPTVFAPTLVQLVIDALSQTLPDDTDETSESFHILHVALPLCRANASEQSTYETVVRAVLQVVGSHPLHSECVRVVDILRSSSLLTAPLESEFADHLKLFPESHDTGAQPEAYSLLDMEAAVSTETEPTAPTHTSISTESTHQRSLTAEERMALPVGYVEAGDVFALQLTPDMYEFDNSDLSIPNTVGDSVHDGFANPTMVPQRGTANTGEMGDADALRAAPLSARLDGCFVGLME